MPYLEHLGAPSCRHRAFNARTNFLMILSMDRIASLTAVAVSPRSRAVFAARNNFPALHKLTAAATMHQGD